jgi:hypothetical protein
MGKELRGQKQLLPFWPELMPFQAFFFPGMLYLIRIPCGSTSRIKRIISDLRIDLLTMMSGRPR